jgi:hypothetical protein
MSFSDAWSAVVEFMESASTGTMTDDTMDSYKIALPSGLSSKGVDSCITFCTNSSRPKTFEALSKNTCCELLSTMTNWIFTNFRACASPESYFVRATIAEDSNPKSETDKQKVVLVGASNLNRSVASFSDLSLDFSNKSVADCTPSPENIGLLSDMLRQQHELGAKAFVFDIFGNIELRYKQYDGTTLLLFKGQGFHLDGKVVVCPVDLFKRTIDSMAPIFVALKDTPSVIILYPQCRGGFLEGVAMTLDIALQ